MSGNKLRGRPEIEETTGSVYSIMRSLEVGDRLIVPSECKNAARSSASNFKRIYGVRYTVNQLKDKFGNSRWLVVKRLE